MDILPQDSTPRKRCANPNCHQWHPAAPEFFSRDRSKRDGFYIYCKACEAERSKARWQRTKSQNTPSKERKPRKKRLPAEQREHKREYAKRYRETDNWKAYNREYRRRYKQEHKEEISERSRRYAEPRREALAEYQRQYRQTAKGKAASKAHKQKRRSQKLASGGTHTMKQLLEQLQRQKNKCYYCQAKLYKEWHPDHVVPLNRGGSNDISNIVIACPACNMHKHDKLPHEWHQGNRLL